MIQNKIKSHYQIKNEENEEISYWRSRVCW